MLVKGELADGVEFGYGWFRMISTGQVSGAPSECQAQIMAAACHASIGNDLRTGDLHERIVLTSDQADWPTTSQDLLFATKMVKV